MKSAERTRAKTLALCVLMLAVALLAWYAGTRAPDNAVNDGRYTPVGNSFARFSSNGVEVVTREGETLYSAEFDYPDRLLTRSGETAAAWTGEGEMLLLGEGGYRRVSVRGELLGVFGSECGAVCAITAAESGGERIALYGAYGEVFSFEPEGRAIAAAVSPDGGALAVLTLDGAFYVSAYSLPLGGALWRRGLDSAAYDLEWEGSSRVRADTGSGELYIDALTGETLPQG